MNVLKQISKRKQFCIVLNEIKRTKNQYVGSYQARLFDYISKQPHCKTVTQENLFQNQSMEIVESKNFHITSKTQLYDIFRSLDVTMKKNPSLITSSNIYKLTMKLVPHIIHDKSIERSDLIKLMFYIGLQKKTHQAQSLMRITLLRIEESLSSLSLLDACIIANAIFKTSTSNISQALIDHIKLQLNSKFQQIKKDPATLICLTKLLRITKQSDYSLLKKLADTNNDWAQNFTTKAHIIALFAESKYYDQNFLQLIAKSGVDDLRNMSSIRKSDNMYFEKHKRGKDIARFLWALSALGIVLEDDLTNVIIPLLKDRLQFTKEYKKQPAVLIDSVMSLCIMGHYSKELMKWIFSEQVTDILKEKKKIQPWTKLNLLLAASKVECPEVSSGFQYSGPVLPEPKAELDLQQREPLKRVFEALRCLAPSLKLETPKCCFQIPPLHIAGLVMHPMQKMNELHIEVADSAVCLHDTSLLIGLMKLKLRLLKNMRDKNVLLVGSTELAADDANLFMWLEDNLKKYLLP